MTIRAYRIPAHQKFAATALAAFALVALAAWGFGRALAGVRQADAARLAVQEKIADADEERRQARAGGKLLEERKEDLGRITRFFANRKNPIAFIESVERAGAQTGTRVVLDVDEGASSDRVLHFRLTVQGREDHLLLFARVLELLPFLIDIREMVFQNASSDGVTEPPQKSVSMLLLSLDVGAR